MRVTDVLVVGGGPSGCAAAMACARSGHEVTLIDAGLDRTRHLSGELLHPAGVEALRTLGFGPVIDRVSGSRVSGFAAVDISSGMARPHFLPYGEGEFGLAAEHARLTVPLLDFMEQVQGVRVLRNTRLTELRHNDARGVEVRLARSEGAHAGGPVESAFRARMLVGADGRASRVRKLLGIAESQARISTMVGLTVDPSALPFPDHGHLFVGGRALLLAYAIGPEAARVMIDLPLGSRPERLFTTPSLLDGVPPALRKEILASLRRTSPRVTSNDRRLPEAVTLGSSVLVGDAAGCCHPLSASGLTSAVKDALALSEALSERGVHVPEALSRYAHVRRPLQRTRIALASALYQAFSSGSAEMQALRVGLFDYWRNTRDGARISMALLASREGRMWVMAKEYTRVVARGLKALVLSPPDGLGEELFDRARAAFGLLASTHPHLRTTAVGALEDLTALSKGLAARSAPAPEPVPHPVATSSATLPKARIPAHATLRGRGLSGASWIRGRRRTRTPTERAPTR